MKTTLPKILVSTMLVFAFLPFMSAHADIDITSAEIQAIAEDGYIYGLPIVMNYGVMNEYAINRDSGQFKAPFNHIKNEARVLTYKDKEIRAKLAKIGVGPDKTFNFEDLSPEHKKAIAVFSLFDLNRFNCTKIHYLKV